MRTVSVGLAVEGARLALGVTDLVVPGRLPFGTDHERTFPSAVFRVLGLRQVVQGVATARGGASAHAVGGCIDALHALSMLALAAASHRYRRAAGIQVVVAGTLATLELSHLSGGDDCEHRP